MTQQIINIGSAPNDGTGDPNRNAFDKCNQNFTELYADVAANLPIGNAIEYHFNNSTAEPPASGQIRFNQATQSSTTLLWANQTTASGINIKQFLSAAVSGSTIIIQDKNDNTNYIKFSVTGAPVDKTTYWQFPVSVTASGGTLPNAEILASVTPNISAGGGGNVSNVGTPSNGQLAQWTDATHIQGIAASSLGFATTSYVDAADALKAPLASPIFTGDPQAPTPATADNDTSIATTAFVKAQGPYQPLDATLTALAAYNTNGLLTQTAADTFTGRTLTGPAAGITVSNGNGVAGNPTLALANDLSALEGASGTNTIYYRSAVDTWSAVTMGANMTFSGGVLNSTGGAAGGVVVQQAYAESTTFTTGIAGNTGSNNATPTITMGTQVLSMSFTPTSSTNKLNFRVSGQVGADANATHAVLALFQTGVTNALAARSAFLSVGGAEAALVFEYEAAAGSTSALTFSIRAMVLGTSTNSFSVNGLSSAAILGGTSRLSLSITEHT